jgi:hypothetical protein
VTPRPVAEVEAQLVAAFADARSTVVERPDLFARVERSIEQDRARRRFRRRLAVSTTVYVICVGGLALLLSDVRQGRIVMPWWAIELVTDIVLVTLAVVLGPFIKRFGRSYAADVFRASPRTGKSYLVLTDVAYYLIFAAFILFTVRFEEQRSWAESRAELLQFEFARVGGILLIMGVLHTANVLALPVIGNLLRGVRAQPTPTGTPPVNAGAWVVRFEPAPGAPDDAAGPDGPGQSS